VGALLGMGLGMGLVLVWLAVTSPRPLPRTGTAARTGRTRELLDRADLADTSVTDVYAVCAAALVCFVAVQAVSQTATVAATFGLLGGYLPVATLAGRARRRQRELAEVWPEAVDNLASAVRAGMSLPEALTQLGHRGPEPLRVPTGLDRERRPSVLTVDERGSRLGTCASIAARKDTATPRGTGPRWSLIVTSHGARVVTPVQRKRSSRLLLLLA